MTMGMGASQPVLSAKALAEIDGETGPPPLVDEPDDENVQSGEIQSEVSSADTEDQYQFLLSHFEADKLSLCRTPRLSVGSCT